MSEIEYIPIESETKEYVPMKELLDCFSDFMTIRDVYPEDVIHDSIIYASNFVN